MTRRVRSFPPLLGTDARLLILGSMPGIASLQANRYYAHPRNQFWPILGELLGFDANDAYAQRVEALHAAGIAVWDVLAECEREGSLDTAIDRRSEFPNDIPGLLAAQTSIRRVLLNGQKAATSLQRHFPTLRIDRVTLPSTSPANASIDRTRKLAAWQAALFDQG